MGFRQGGWVLGAELGVRIGREEIMRSMD